MFKIQDLSHQCTCSDEISFISHPQCNKTIKTGAPRWPSGPIVCTYRLQVFKTGLTASWVFDSRSRQPLLHVSPLLSLPLSCLSSLITINKGKKPKTNLKKKKSGTATIFVFLQFFMCFFFFFFLRFVFGHFAFIDSY